MARKKADRESPGMPTPADMEVTPERALMIKRALVRQYAHQNNIEITGWQEMKDGKLYTVKIINDKAVVQSVTDFNESMMREADYGKGMDGRKGNLVV